jgi:ABC-type phosphate transport system substrate-binding protein
MSKDLSVTCNGGGGTDALKSFPVARDAVLALTPTANTVPTNVTQADLAKAFCATGTGAGTCAASVVLGSTTYTKFYRRDDASGTTDAFEKTLGAGVCNSLCNDAAHVVISDTTPRTAPCAAGDSDTQCLAKYVQANQGATAGTFVLGYAGLSARTVTTPAKELTVAGQAPTTANIQSGVYPLSRNLYVNYNATMLGARTTSTVPGANATLPEKKFLCENVLGPTFNNGTFSCSSLTGLTDKRSAFKTSLLGTLGDFVDCNATGTVTPVFLCKTGAGNVFCP